MLLEMLVEGFAEIPYQIFRYILGSIEAVLGGIYFFVWLLTLGPFRTGRI